MKKSNVLNISIANPTKTSLAEAGVFHTDLAEGTRIAVIGSCYFPDHDRALIDGILKPFLRNFKPHLLVALGSMIHDDAFQAFAPQKESRHRIGGHKHVTAPEIARILGTRDNRPYETFEEQVTAFGAECGGFLTSLADAGDSTLVYAPSASPAPNEAEIMTFLQYTKRRIDEWNDRHATEEEAPEYQAIPTQWEDYDLLLGLRGNERVHVLPFGGALIANEKNLFWVGDFKRRNPVTAGFVAFEQKHMNVWHGYGGKLADGWFTTSQQTLPNIRRYHQFHEVPNLMDDARMGYTRDYDRTAKGFFAGTIVRGEVHGCTFPILPGADGRRGVVIDGVGYAEETPGGLGRRGKIALARRVS